MLEDLQCGLPKEKSTMLDIKIGFQTHRADHKDANKAKESYYKKAITGKKSLAPLCTQEEVQTETMTKSRYMHISNMNSSTCSHGFRIDGCRVNAFPSVAFKGSDRSIPYDFYYVIHTLFVR